MPATEAQTTNTAGQSLPLAPWSVRSWRVGKRPERPMKVKLLGFATVALRLKEFEVPDERIYCSANEDGR